ncbi:Carbon-nitrogen hydrolase [Ceraceosorus bombacis]|uniref:Carbon-nitrogen hydrolase n=1 Tax=Ceraceosorus bombacis TaxID=401625 RepID=A0A0P1B9N7_9BASI|nr:Carbon-nitrogen hydrolase [Ceraceosorus bombacis]
MAVPNVPPFKVAAVQAEPVWLNARATAEKTCTLIKEAASSGAKLIASPELWIPGYPHFLWVKDFGSSMPFSIKYAAHALTAESPEIQLIKDACAANSIWTSFGFAERRNGSMYMSNCIINSEGNIVNIRRKIKPTGLERVLFGEASGDALDNVVTTPFGRVGNLQCWEHIQPLLKYHTYSLHEHIHVASWPGCFPLKGGEPYSMTSDGVKALSSVYAIEGGSFTVMTTQLVTEENAQAVGLDYRPNGPSDHDFFLPPGGGCAAIFAPDGRELTTPLPCAQEGILYAEIDYSMSNATKLLADCVGHYSRPDLLRLSVNRKVQSVTAAGETKQPDVTELTAQA